MIEKMHETSFDWLTWRGGGLSELGVIQREVHIIPNADTIRRFAIGYCPAENLICRPKQDCVAVMFLKDEHKFWTHLTRKEFKIIFNTDSVPIITGEESR